MKLGLLRTLMLASALAGAASSAVSAQSLKAIRAHEAEESQLGREIAYTNSVCKTRLKARVDWAASSGWPAAASIVEACNGALGAVEAACRAGESSTVGAWSGFVCAGDGAGPSIAGGDLRYGATPGGDSFAEMRAFLDSAF